MRANEIKDRRRLMDAALGRIPCDLSVINVRLANVLTGEIYPAQVDILDGAVVRVREEGAAAPLPAREVFDGGGRYLAPGLIDTHMHVESTMMIPQYAARAVLPWGTTTICTDPHEIANVMGEEGVRFMLENSKKAALRQYVLAPSCVPAVPELESAGAFFSWEQVGKILDSDGVVGVAEIMDYVGLVNGSPRMAAITYEGLKRRMFLQGHAPGAEGGILAAYRIGGPASDHESGSAEEIREKLRAGMRVNLRASSISDKLEELVQGLDHMAWLDQVSICTDDVHAKDLLKKGHVNAVVARLIKGGMSPLAAYKLCSLNAAREYGFDDLGAIAPGFIADMQLLDQLDGSRPYAVFVKGRMAAQNGRYLLDDGSDECEILPKNTMNGAAVSGAQDFLKPAPANQKKAEVLVIGRSGAGHGREGEWMELPVKDGFVSLEGHEELSFVSVVNRYGTGGKSIAVTRDFGLTQGAIASTVSHDSHNFIVVYKEASSACACFQKLTQTGGGMCAAQNGECTETLPLPVAGLMSLEPCECLAPKIDRMEEAMRSMCRLPFSLLDIAVYALPVVPGLVVTDRGMVNSLEQKFIKDIR